jgi:hypothetical protein
LHAAAGKWGTFVSHSQTHPETLAGWLRTDAAAASKQRALALLHCTVLY